MRWRPGRWAATVALLPTLALNLWILRAERQPVQNINDGAMHAQMVRFARMTMDGGRLPINAWYPYLQLGSPHFQHYPSLGHTLTAALGYLVGADRVYSLSVYLLLALWPLSVYVATRIIGLGRWAAVAAAAATPLVISVPGYGYEYGSYVWAGWGGWGQLWAMVTLPLALALSWRAVITGRGYARAAALLGLTMAFHFLTGYLAVLAVGLGALVVRGQFLSPAFRARGLNGAVARVAGQLARAGGIVVAAVALGSFEIVPLIRGRVWTAAGELGPDDRFYVDSHGAKQVLTWLVHGDLYDQGRGWLSVLTVLVALGLVACLVRWRSEPRGRLLVSFWVLSMVLFFGPATWGFVPYERIPGASSLLYHRMIIGVHLSGLLLAGVGVGWLVQLATLATRRIVPDARRHAPRVGLAAVALPLVAFAAVSGWPQVAAVASNSREYVEFQRDTERSDGAALQVLLDRVRGYGDGRVYAGLRANWGARFTVGAVPVYSMVAGADLDAVGFTYRTPSLMADVEAYFNEGDPEDYDLFNVRYLLLPQGSEPQVPATFLGQSGRYTLWSVRTAGYLGVYDTGAPIEVPDREDYRRYVLPTLSRPLASVLPSVEYGGRKPAPVSAVLGATTGSPGTVTAQAAVVADGTFTAQVDMARRGAVVLKVAFDPGWHATVDGADAETFIAAPGLVGVMVPQGHHVVAMTFRSTTRVWLYLLAGLLALGLASAASKHQHRQEERAQHGLHPEDEAGQGRDDDAQALAGVERPERLGAPLVEAVHRPADPGERQDRADEQPDLERGPAEDAGHPGVGGQQPLADGERLREQREHDRLEADDDGERRVQQGLHVEPEAADGPAAWDEPDAERRADDDEQ